MEKEGLQLFYIYIRLNLYLSLPHTFLSPSSQMPPFYSSSHLTTLSFLGTCPAASIHPIFASSRLDRSLSSGLRAWLRGARSLRCGKVVACVRKITEEAMAVMIRARDIVFITFRERFRLYEVLLEAST